MTLNSSQKRAPHLSRHEEAFALQVRAMQREEGMVREHRFSPTRQWRFDFAWPAHWLAVEIEGGIWNQGRHTRGVGFELDCKKYNTATLLGWRVLRYTATGVTDGSAIADVVSMLRTPAHGQGVPR